MNRFTILGTTDERTSCDCCGRSDLKSTVALADTETGIDVFFGSVCAANAMKLSVREANASAKAADHAREAAERKAREAAATVRANEWRAFLTEATGGLRDFGGLPDVFAMIQKLGGMKAARALFECRVAA